MQNAFSIAIEDGAVRDESVENERCSFAELVQRHSTLVYRVALVVTRNRHDAEDVAQEAFLQLLRGGRWWQIEDERGYLARVTWRLAVRRKTRPAEEELPPQLYSAAANPEAEAIDADLEAWLHSRIDQLPEKLRQPLALAALGDWKLVEIAEILGLPEGTVRRRIHTARQKLKQELLERNKGSGVRGQGSGVRDQFHTWRVGESRWGTGTERRKP